MRIPEDLTLIELEYYNTLTKLEKLIWKPERLPYGNRVTISSIFAKLYPDMRGEPGTMKDLVFKENPFLKITK